MTKNKKQETRAYAFRLPPLLAVPAGILPEVYLCLSQRFDSPFPKYSAPREGTYLVLLDLLIVIARQPCSPSLAVARQTPSTALTATPPRYSLVFFLF